MPLTRDAPKNHSLLRKIGPEKLPRYAAEAARALADGASVAETPAAGVRGQAETVWFLDRDAASQV